MKKIAVVVLNWKTAKLTTDTVNSLLKIKHPDFNFKIFIIDNGSRDGSVEHFKQQFGGNKQIAIYDTGANLGYVDGNNFGIKIALRENHDYVLVINSDVIVKPDFLQIMYDYLEKHQDYGLVGPKIYFAPGFEFHKDRYIAKELGKVIWSAGGIIDWSNVYGTNFGMDEVDHGQFDQIRSNVDYLSGCCLLIRSAVFQKVGLFDSRYFMYSEDAEFSRRLLAAGIRIAYLPNAIVWHFNSGSSGRGPLHDYFLTRNRLIFGFQYSRWKTKFALFRDSLRILLFSPYLWQKYGVRDYYLKKFGKGSWK